MSSDNAVWVILPEGCIEGDPSNCVDLRGSELRHNRSITWSDMGLYNLGLIEESLLGYSGNGDFGNDSITFGWPGDGLPMIEDEVV